MSEPKYPRDLLARTAAEAGSLVDLMRRVGAPLGSGPRRYLRDRLAHYSIDTSHFADEPLPPRPAHSYPREVLEAAAAHSHSVGEMLAYMGVAPYDSAYSHISGRLVKFGIDTSHFTGRRRHGPLLPRDELARAVADSQSLPGVIRALGEVSPGGVSRAEVRRGIAAYGLSTAHFTGQRHNAGRRAPTRKAAEDILRKLPPGSSRTKTLLLRRALDDEGVPHVCSACGLGDSWQGKRLVLEIDHINGDRLDNRRDNLRYLCPSCHSQTVTFSNRYRFTTTPPGPVQ
ncbi:hypothetical protein GCM10010387_53150 [Streptomyces inusitatus]|uniref:HNH nuclease domain-containing protein n=1 Tax=Streptomyces inusitatus TaxID=68221 RepID=A0A918V0C9_9ACTN|nr:HNH endonuclease [Streptomyces inusitatus]GGZ52241.1 hypothetical protein GCM10010387_53150 [Streptomyces inusitatus]